MKIGDLVMFTPDGVATKPDDWYGIVLRAIPGTDERKVVMWNRNNVKTTNKKKI